MIDRTLAALLDIEVHLSYPRPLILAIFNLNFFIVCFLPAAIVSPVSLIKGMKSMKFSFTLPSLSINLNAHTLFCEVASSAKIKKRFESFISLIISFNIKYFFYKFDKYTLYKLT